QLAGALRPVPAPAGEPWGPRPQPGRAGRGGFRGARHRAGVGGDRDAVHRRAIVSDERRISRLMAGLLLMSVAAGLGLLVLYALGGQVQLEGGLLFVALTGIGFALILWGKYLFPPEIVTEPRGEHPSSPGEQRGAEQAYLEGEAQISRRSLLVRLMLGPFRALVLAAIFPIRSLC